MRRFTKGALLALAIFGGLGLQGMLHSHQAPASPGYSAGTGRQARCCSHQRNVFEPVHVHFSGAYLNRRGR